MERDATLAIKRAGIVLVAVVAALGCGGGSLSGNGGSGGAGGGGGGSPAPCCYKEALPVASVVRAHGFTAYEGLPVKAVFFYASPAMPNGRTTVDTSVSGGAFDLDFLPDNPTCAVSYANGTGVIYIDTDGDGVCNPAVDYLYVWPALGAASSTCATIDLTPQSPHCGGAKDYVAAVEAAQIVCPATNGCLSCDGGLSFICLI